MKKKKTMIEISDDDETPDIEIVKSAPVACFLRKQAGRKRRARMEDYRKKTKRNAIVVLFNVKNKAKNSDEVIITDENIQHPKERRKIRETRIARDNSAAVNALFSIDFEGYLGKPLVFDLKSTREEEIFDWLLSNISLDNDMYYIEHEDGCFEQERTNNGQNKKTF